MELHPRPNARQHLVFNGLRELAERYKMTTLCPSANLPYTNKRLMGQFRKGDSTVLWTSITFSGLSPIHPAPASPRSHAGACRKSECTSSCSGCSRGPGGPESRQHPRSGLTDASRTSVSARACAPFPPVYLRLRNTAASAGAADILKSHGD